MDTPYQGLTSGEVQKKLISVGQNIIPEKKKSFAKKLFGLLVSPIALMLVLVAVLSLAMGQVTNFWIIAVLYSINLGISFWHEHKADKAIENLRKNLSVVVWVLRDAEWKHVSSTLLVPGDVIRLDVGAIVPADITLLEALNVTVNEAALTGESLPREKNLGDTMYSGSFLVAGRAIARVENTGAHTYFGKTMALVDDTRQKSSLEKDILSISRFLGIVSVITVFVVSIIFLVRGAPFLEILTLSVGIIIAGIPVELPTIMSLILSVGVFELAKKGIVVRRLSSLEDMANVDLLLTDKTGTLTSNQIKVEQIVTFGSYATNEVLAFAVSAIDEVGRGSIEEAIFEKTKELNVVPYQKTEFIPADSERKRSTATIEKAGHPLTVSLGAPQVIEGLCAFVSTETDRYTHAVAEAARLGLRTLAVSVNLQGKGENGMEAVGLILLSDTVHPNSKSVIKFMYDNGITVKMLTGDNQEISARVASMLGLRGEIKHREDMGDTLSTDMLESAAGFSEILPEDKYRLVMAFREHHTVAVTGDGVNDIPAVKSAVVGIAVSNAVDALKSTADIVLLTEGIAVIKDAIIESRKIFVRLYNYSIYRISESFRIVVLVAVIGLFFNEYAVTPIQLIMLALLNDLPLVSLAFDNVKASGEPAKIHPKERLALSLLFGMVGIVNSLIMLWIAQKVFNLDWEHIQTLFFLKLVISGHMLIYVAHTTERWYRFLPSKQVIYATTATQVVATGMVLGGVFFAPLPLSIVIFVWGWTLCWMQISELMKVLHARIVRK